MSISNTLPDGYQGKCALSYTVKGIHFIDVIRTPVEAKKAAQHANDRDPGDSNNIQLDPADPGRFRSWLNTRNSTEKEG